MIFPSVIQESCLPCLTCLSGSNGTGEGPSERAGSVAETPMSLVLRVCLAWPYSDQPSLFAPDQGVPGLGTCSAKLEIVPDKLGWGTDMGPPLPQPCSFQGGCTLHPLRTPQPPGTHPLPVSPAPHCPLHSHRSYHLLEVTLNSPFLGPSPSSVSKGGWNRCSKVPWAPGL